MRTTLPLIVILILAIALVALVWPAGSAAGHQLSPPATWVPYPPPATSVPEPAPTGGAWISPLATPTAAPADGVAPGGGGYWRDRLPTP